MKTLVLLVSVTCFGQSAAFEVASVKVHQGLGQTRITTSGSRFRGEAQHILSLLTFSTIHGFQPQNSASEKEVYASYSLMLTYPKTSHGADKNERYLIAATTAPGRPEEPCIQPPRERDADLREVLADYKRRRLTPRKLETGILGREAV